MYRPLPSIGSKSRSWVVGWMYQVDVYLRVRRAVMVDGMSIREVSRVIACAELLPALIIFLSRPFSCVVSRTAYFSLTITATPINTVCPPA